jgi:hypothetical protein
MKKVCNDTHLYRSFGKQYEGLWHLGKDYSTVYNDNIFAPTDLNIINIVFANGYGSLNPSRKGYVVFADGIINGKKYNFNFGHVIPKVLKGDVIKEGDIIGTVAKFQNNGENLPHLHFGIHEGFGIPLSPWGYVGDVKQLIGWIDPVSLGLG